VKKRDKKKRARKREAEQCAESKCENCSNREMVYFGKGSVCVGRHLGTCKAPHWKGYAPAQEKVA